MKYELIKGQGNYEVKLSIDSKAQDEMKDGALKLAQKDFDFAGFRKGHVPLNIVEKNIKPEYLQMAMYEEAINKGLQQIVKENEKTQFIGQPYDLQDNKDDKGHRTITFKLDTYPEVEVKDKKWESIKMETLDTAPTKEEEENALNNLTRQYADYQDSDTIAEDTVTKLKFVMKDVEGKEIDSGSAFIGKEEFEEFTLVKKEFIGKKKDETVEIAYDEKKLPHILHFHPKDEAKKTLKAKTVEATIVDIKKVVMPDLNDSEVLKRLFQSDEITSYESLTKKIHEVLSQQKKENVLQQAVEKVIDEAKSSMSVQIPNTILREEVSARVKQLGDRMGGEAGMKQYFEQVGEEGTKKIYDDVETSAKTSLEKFFILRKLIELLGIENVDWNSPLDAENKLYDALHTGTTKTKTTKATSDSAPAKKVPATKAKKAPAKKKKEE